MTKEHIPDGKTNVSLFLLRSRARTADIQRRSKNKESLAGNEEALEKITDESNKALHKQSVRKLNNAEQTIVALLRNSEAFQKTIDRLTEAWGEDKEKALGFAQEVLDKTCKELDEDYSYKAKAGAWAQSQMAADNERVVPPPRLKKR